MENNSEVKPGTPNAEQSEVPPAAPKSNVILVGIGDKGEFDFKNQIELSQSARFSMQMKLVPDHLSKEGVTAVMAAMVFCKQFNLPAKAMNQMAFIKGKLTQFGSLVTGIAETHPAFGEKEEFWIDSEGNRICSDNKNLTARSFAAVCRVKPKTTTVWSEYTFTMNDADQAGLYPPTKWNYVDRQRVGKIPDEDSPWLKYTKDMLMHKARARALNANYASVLNGVQYHEDVREVFEERDAEPVKQQDPVTDEEVSELLAKNG